MLIPVGCSNRKLEKWSFTNIPIKNVIKCQSLYLPVSSILNLKYLKYLKFYGSLKHGCEIFGQEMPNLEHLILNQLWYRDSTRLCLDKLRVLFLRDIFECTLIIDCPKLTALRCNRISSIEIKHPETLTYIGTSNFDDKILNFKNLESIHVNDIDSKENILQQLPHLKLISIYAEHCHRYSLYTLRTLSNLIIEKQNLKSDVKIIYKREEIKNIEQFDELSDDDDPFYYHYLNEPIYSGDFDGYDS